MAIPGPLKPPTPPPTASTSSNESRLSPGHHLMPPQDRVLSSWEPATPALLLTFPTLSATATAPSTSRGVPEAIPTSNFPPQPYPQSRNIFRLPPPLSLSASSPRLYLSVFCFHFHLRQNPRVFYATSISVLLSVPPATIISTSPQYICLPLICAPSAICYP